VTDWPWQPERKDPLEERAWRRNPNPEVIHQPVYTRITIPAHTPGFANYAFGYARGQHIPELGRVSTLHDTNLDQANVMPSRKFEFQTLVIVITAATLSDYLDVYNNLFGEFRVVDKNMLYFVMQHLCPMYVANLRPASTLPRNVKDLHLNPRYRRFSHKLQTPILINPYEFFQLRVDCDVDLAYAVGLYIALDGLMWRPV